MLFNRESNNFGVGVIARNSAGSIQVAMAKTPASSNVMIAEVMVMFHGIKLCMEFKIAPVEIFTYSFFLVAKLMPIRGRKMRLYRKI